MLNISHDTTVPILGEKEMCGVAAGGVCTFLFAAIVLMWRQSMSLDATKHNHGILQFSSFFYRNSGPIMDFINASPYIVNIVPTMTVFVGIYLRETYGRDWMTFFTFFAGFVVVPVVDLMIGEDSYNPTPEEETRLRNNKWFSFHLCLYVWTYVATVLFIAYYIGTESGHLTGGPNELSTTALVGIASSLGISSGFGIGAIHELIHRPSHLLLNHARTVLLFSNYNHFWIEHLWGHHKRVATEEDPASSRLNEGFWMFIFKCLYQSLVSACHLEAQFLRNKGLPWYHTGNRILYPFLCSFMIDGMIYMICGPSAFAVQMIQSFLTAMLTDNANYIEHYGLRREKKSDATDQWGLANDYERPGWMHAWNTGDRLTNWLLFKIERHPDHHVNAGRPYQILRTFKESPTYPTGYAGMFVLSWFPPLFFRVMNPLVEKAEADLKEQIRTNTYAQIFPKGANNISSVFKKVGEDFYEAGSDGCDKLKKNDSETAAVWTIKDNSKKKN